jgi:hypothetical protein
VPAAGLADVGIRDAHPLVLGGGVQHPLQQIAVLSLELGLVPEGPVGGRDPLCQGIAHPLQLPQVRDPRFAWRRSDDGLDLDPRKGLDHQVRELGLEATDLSAQLGASEALVAPHPKRVRRVQFEQIRHEQFECRSRSRSRKREHR